MVAVYRNRRDAGRELAAQLAHHHGRRPVVLGLVPGGVVVAAEVAEALEGSLYAVVALPLGLPESPGLSVGAVGPDGIPVIEEDLLARLGLTPGDLAGETRRLAEEARRREAPLRRGAALEVRDRVVLVVDEGVAGGATLRAALARARRAGAAFLGCAVPVGPPATIDLVAAEADEVVCLQQPLRFRSVAEAYEDFPEMDDAGAASLLEAFLC
ncbi:MAG: phosphoribosyltransferase [Acidimicrobiia bacterium]|nr:phosphoribosyltransferase [Acidimicrobiia bacterium]